MKEISIKDFKEIRIGQVEDKKSGTGVTVVIGDKGFNAGLDVRGGGPALRDSHSLNPMTNELQLNSIVFAGGSAFGLNATGGVQKYLEERNIGLDVGVTKVPLVCQADIFDLEIGDPFVRPDEDMAYQACLNSEKNNYQDGSFGAGCGATVGKYFGVKRCMKSGIGSYAVSLGDLKVAALVVVNAFGDVYENGKQIAGLLSEDQKSLLNTYDLMCDTVTLPENMLVGNTTLGLIITNAKFNKLDLCKISSIANNAYGSSIRPVNTSADGDCIFSISVGDVNASADLVGTVASDIMSKAIVCAIKSAESLFDRPAYKDINK